MGACVSVIIPNYNKGNLVKQSLESLLKQTYGDWKAIVVDDCSSDESWDIIQAYAKKDSRIRCVRNDENQGGNYSRNRGARMASGEYLIFLDSDDWMLEDCLERRVLEFNRSENTSVDLLIFNMALASDGKERNVWNGGNRKVPLISFLRHEMPWTIMMPIWRKKAFDRIGGFDETFPRLQDVELHTRALLNGITYRFAERKTPDCCYFIDDSRMTMRYEEALSRSVAAMLMYVVKMHGQVKTRREMVALRETLMAAIRMVGDTYQAGRIEHAVRIQLKNEVLAATGVNAWIKLYAWCYARRINRFHGFNKIFRLVYRIFG